MNNGSRTPGVASKIAGPGPGHNGWMMTSSALVLFMTLPGLALFYGGLVRRKNVLSRPRPVHRDRRPGRHPVVGGRLQPGLFPGHRPLLGGLGLRLPQGTSHSAPNTDYGSWVSQNVYAMYQLMFAIITPALIMGAIAERMKFSRGPHLRRALDVPRLLPARPHGLGHRRPDERGLERRRPRSARSTLPAERSSTCPPAGRPSSSA